MSTVSAKFSPDENQKLNEICATLKIDKSEALRRATAQLWQALQIGKTFEERAGGRPQFLLRSGNREASTRSSRQQTMEDHLTERSRKRKSTGKTNAHSSD